MANTAPIVTRDQIVRDIQAWDGIADHRTGSAGDAQTDAWLSDEIHAAGSTAEVRRYPFERVDIERCWAQISGGPRITGVPMFDASPTGAEPVQGIAGADIPVSRFAPFDAHPLTEHTQRLRHDNTHKAIVAVSAAQGVRPGLALLNAEHYRTPFGPPVIQISSFEGADLLAHEGRSMQVLADFTRSKADASNLEARIPGTNRDAAPVVIMTPKSAWWTCTAERAGGIVVWLALLRHFAANPPRRTVLFTANSGHELSHLGLDYYLASNPDLAKSAHVWLHLGANFAATGGHIRIQASDEQGLIALTHALDDNGVSGHDASKLGERPLGEARNIYDNGGRYLSILGSNPWFHQPTDRFPTTIDLDKTVAVTKALVALMAHTVNA
jgi:hypothetical protein